MNARNSQMLDPIPSGDTLDRKKLARVEARLATEPICHWYDRATAAFWGRVDRLAKYFLESLKQVQAQNPFVGIACILFYFVAGMVVVTPLFMVIGPIVQAWR